jgi:hypothetical protein
VAACSLVKGRPSLETVGKAVNLRVEKVGLSKMVEASLVVLKRERTASKAALLVSCSTALLKTIVICRRTPRWMSLILPSNFLSIREALAAETVAGREGGMAAEAGSRTAMVLARMPLTRHLGRFLGAGADGEGVVAVLRLDPATARRTVSLGAPGSSLETRSKRVMAFLICRVVGRGAEASFFLGPLG